MCIVYHNFFPQIFKATQLSKKKYFSRKCPMHCLSSWPKKMFTSYQIRGCQIGYLALLSH